MPGAFLITVGAGYQDGGSNKCEITKGRYYSTIHA
ncbi:hypothetical protein OCHUTO_0936 [Orientia chuto str. Dubai]|uniref:Uncharacterized protein n=1 Tax=Orientia chuto str. Dubai TaxID=1359168 RepID=A0A0F3MHS0_9RICK|nr:hypothetical protein OCHUTO_0936 [Orientia chuto str. Dubai]